MTTFTIPRGSTKTMSIVVKNSRGVVQDITGMTIEVAVKRNPDDREEELVFKTTATPGDGEFVNAVLGLVDMYFLPADTEDLTPDTYWFDVWAVEGADRYQIVVPSKFIVAGRVLDMDGA